MDDKSSACQPREGTSYKVTLLAGGVSGTAVDVLLFPLDTVKTRLQSVSGLRASGGFKGLHSGILSVIVGSAPSAALFFLAYETTKDCLVRSDPSLTSSHGGLYEMASHMAAACLGDITSCLIRVPVEIVKQRTQAGNQGGAVVERRRKIRVGVRPQINCTTASSSSYATLVTTYRAGGLSGFYQGYWSTVLREVPFSVVQLPMWEFLKSRCSQACGGQPVTAGQSALCAAVAGGTAAVLTTPLDVAKTRIMLASQGSVEARGSVAAVLCAVFKDKGLPGLFTGLLPRLALMSIGGGIFLGAYDKVKLLVGGVT